MPENNTSAAPSQPPKPAPASAPDAGHIPMTEELDRAKWTLPPFRIIGLGLLIFAVIAGVAIFLSRQKPAAAGSIDNVTAVALPQNQVMVAINVTFTNALPEKPFFLRGVTARLTKPDGEKVTDTAASAVDFERYFQAFPELKQNALQPLM